MIDSEISIKIRLFNSNNNNQDCLLGLRDVMLHKTAIYLYGRSFIVMTIVQLKTKKVNWPYRTVLYIYTL